MSEQRQQQQLTSKRLTLNKYSLYGKSPDGDQRGAPVIKVSVNGPSQVGFVCYPNNASDVENEYIYAGLHQVSLIPFLDTVMKNIEEVQQGAIGRELVLSRNEIRKYQDNEKHIECDLVFLIDKETGVRIGVRAPGKTFITIGLREISGYETTIMSKDDSETPPGADPCAYGLSWIKGLSETLVLTSVLIDQHNMVAMGGDTPPPSGNARATNF